MNIKNIINKNKALIRYFCYSCFVTVIDLTMVWILMKFGMSLVLSNTIGVIIGFIIHYILSSKSVFDTDYGVKGFLVYLMTFIFGLVFADALIYVSYHYLFFMFGNDINLTLSKGVSIAVPFFVLYFARKYAYKFIDKNGGAKS